MQLSARLSLGEITERFLPIMSSTTACIVSRILPFKLMKVNVLRGIMQGFNREQISLNEIKLSSAIYSSDIL